MVKTRVLMAFVMGGMLMRGAFGQVTTQTPGPMPEMTRAKTTEISTMLKVTADGKTSSFNAADLLAMPQTTVSVMNTHSKMQESYTGVRLSALLARAGLRALDKHMKDSPMLRSYVRATGTDHYWVLYSGDEFEPEAHAGEVIVALAVGGKELGEDGQFKLVSTEDKEPARWVRNLAVLTVVEGK